jgi:DNA-binding LytR/AlgR family response regulator
MVIMGFITLKWRNNRIKVNTADIVYAESCNRHLIICTCDGKKTEIVGKLGEFFKLLPAELFICCHKSFAVNLKYIAEFNEYGVVMTNGETLPVSVRKKSETLRSFDEFCTGRANEK